MLEYEHHSSREEWLACRGGHLGASEAGAVCGLGFMSPVELWKLKTGTAKAKDLSANQNVAYGNRAEDGLRSLFMAKHPELTLTYHPFDFLYQTERPWLRATLDGELTDEYGRRGVLEIKTASCQKRAEWDAWRNRIPDGYLCQISHQLLATGFDFVYVFAELIAPDGHSELRTYFFLREDMEENLEYVLDEEIKFWNCVVTKTIPPVPLRI